MTIPKQIEDIKGQQTAKRALEIAWVGGHSIMLAGPRGTGKATLRDAFSEVGAVVRDTCACGNRMSVGKLCTCNAVSVTRWLRRLLREAANTDIVVEVPEVPTKELMCNMKGVTGEVILERVIASREWAKSRLSTSLRDSSARMMEMASRRLAFTPGEYGAVIRVARTIASMDRSDELQAKHVAEACQYRSMQRAF